MGTLYQRRKGGLFYGEFYTPEGKRVRRSLKTRDKVVAKERLRLAELGASPAARGRRQRLMDAIDGMIATMHDKADATKGFYQQKGRRLLKTFGNPFIHEIDREMLAAYIKRRLSNDREHGQASAHTVQKELITVRRALREAVDSNVLRAMPAFPRFSPKYKPRETWLTPEQFEAVSAELEPDRRLWASIAALAGGSLSEVEGVAWETVELDAVFELELQGAKVVGRMLIPGTKRETRRRWVPIAPALRHRLLEVPEKKRRGRVVGAWGNVRRDLHAAVARANKLASEQAAQRGEDPPPPIPRVSPNDLRRTFGSWLVQAEVPLLVVATLMGHSSTRMVERVYGRLSKKNLGSAIAKMPALSHKAPALPAGTTIDEVA